MVAPLIAPLPVISIARPLQDSHVEMTSDALPVGTNCWCTTPPISENSWNFLIASRRVAEVLEEDRLLNYEVGLRSCN
jgi:hypothetical protein